MGLRDEDFRAWVSLCEHPTAADLFFIGSVDRRITFYSQQVRALRLVQGLQRLGRLSANDRVGVIGAGAAGTTVALALCAVGIRAEIFERTRYPISLQRGSPRLLHPNIYDWPEPGALDDSAGLPLLTWDRDTGGNVSNSLVHEIARAGRVGAKPPGPRTGIDITRIERSKDGWELGWTEKAKPECEEFDKIVLAVGFGAEGRIGAAVPIDYWRTTGIPTADAENGGGQYLLSGTGDGGLTDLCSLLIDGFTHLQFTEWFLDRVPGSSLSSAANAAHQSALRDGTNDLETELEAQVLPILRRRGVPAELRAKLREDRSVVFNSRSGRFFQPGSAALLNQVMAFAVAGVAAAEKRLVRSIGEITNVEKTADGRLLVSGPGTPTGSPTAFDHVLLRHGPDRRGRFENFTDLFDTYRDHLRLQIASDPTLANPPRLDPETYDFFDNLTDEWHDPGTRHSRRVAREDRNRTLVIDQDRATRFISQRGPRRLSELVSEFTTLDRAYVIQVCLSPAECGTDLAGFLVRLAKASSDRVRIATANRHLAAWQNLHPTAEGFDSCHEPPFARERVADPASLTSALETALLGTVLANRDASGTDVEGPTEMPETNGQLKNLVLRFWNLTASERRDITVRLKLSEEADKSLPDFNRYGKALYRASEQGALDRVEAEINKLEQR